jgi:hypothetical protein
LISGSFAAAINQVSATGAQLRFFSPGFTAADQTMSSNSTSSDILAAFNADLVLTPPSNQFSFGKLKKNKSKGTATIAVNVPGPGTLSLTGKKVKSQRPAREATASKAVTAAGTLKLLVKAKGKAEKKLNKTGKVKVKANVTFIPTGGAANAHTKTVKLVKKR